MVWLLPFLETPQDYLETNTNTSRPSTLHNEEDDDKLTVCLVQPRLREDEDTPLQATDQVVALMQAAACHCQGQQQHIDLFVLPELCPVGYSEDTFANYLPSNSNQTAQAMYHQIDEKLKQAAVSLHSYICYGTIGWKQLEQHPEEEDGRQCQLQYFIRQVVVDPNGHQIASYDKGHLCDYGACAETRFFTPGESVVSFQIIGKHHWKFGIIICADMRYPNLCRTLTRDHDHQVDVILQPACFARDISFATWKAFATTRAVENGVYFVACNYAGDNFGASSITPPWVNENGNDTTHLPQVMNNTAGYMIHTLERAVLHHARTTLPFHKHATQSCSSCPCGCFGSHIGTLHTLRKTKSLNYSYLDSSGNHLDDENVTILVAVIPDNKTLESLHLWNDNITANARKLYLGDNPFEDVGTKAILEALVVNDELQFIGFPAFSWVRENGNLTLPSSRRPNGKCCKSRFRIPRL